MLMTISLERQRKTEKVAERQVNATTMREIVVASLEAPKLRGLSTHHSIELRRAIGLYEKQIEEKNKQSDVQIAATTYKASVEDSDEGILLAAGWIQAALVSQVTELWLKQCVEDRCICNVGEELVYLINETFWKVTVKMNVFETQDQVKALHRDYVQVLKANGYESVPGTKMHVAIAHIMSKVKPPK